MSSARISPTAHYTGYVWYRHGLGHRSLRTVGGRLLAGVMTPIEVVARLAGVPSLEDVLLWRHRTLDRDLERVIESGQVSQVLDVAAGLSPRGLRFAKRYGERIRYLEADLPGMARRKRDALARAGVALGQHHDVIDIDALAEQGTASLAEVAKARLDPLAGLAIVTEGLINYFDREAVMAMWRRFATTIAASGGGVYLSDLHVAADARTTPGMRAMTAAVSLFARGKVHLHFSDDAEVQRALAEAGFASGRIHVARAEAAQAGLPVRILEGRAGQSATLE
jgi:O-methyltransferase involved in polyketide biosynthesis